MESIVTLVCALIAAIATISVAAIQAKSAKVEKTRKEESEVAKEEAEQRAKIRAKESKLSMDMMYSVSKLSIGTAMAIKKGFANGELEEGLKAVASANKNYENFLRETVSEQLTND